MADDTLTPDSFMARGYEGNAYAQNRFTRSPVFLIRKELGDIDLQDQGTGMTEQGITPPPKSVMDTLSPALASQVPQDRGASYVVPSDSYLETNRVIRHEGVHNLLGQAGISKEDLEAFHSRPSVKPLFDEISGSYAGGFMGSSDNEIPAYLVGSPKFGGIDPKVRQQYLDKLVKFVSSKNPHWGKTLKRMIPPDEPSPEAAAMQMEGAKPEGFSEGIALPVPGSTAGSVRPRIISKGIDQEWQKPQSKELTPDDFMSRYR